MTGSPEDGLSVVIAGEAIALFRLVCPLSRFEKGDSDLLWGPAGSRFAVIRTITEGTERWQAFDLGTGYVLLEQAWEVGKRRDKGMWLRVPDLDPGQ